MNPRRKLLFALGTGAAMLAIPALAQQQRGVRRIGFLGAGPAAASTSYLAAFRLGMTELRWSRPESMVESHRIKIALPVEFAAKALYLGLLLQAQQGAQPQLHGFAFCL